MSEKQAAAVYSSEDIRTLSNAYMDAPTEAARKAALAVNPALAAHKAKLERKLLVVGMPLPSQVAAYVAEKPILAYSAAANSALTAGRNAWWLVGKGLDLYRWIRGGV